VVLFRHAHTLRKGTRRHYRFAGFGRVVGIVPGVSDKQTCPACEAHTSSVRGAFLRGEPCPHCGLSAGAALELETARSRGAGWAMVRQTAQAVRRAEAAEAEAARLRGLIGRARQALDDAGPVGPHAWQEYNQDGSTCHFPGCGQTEQEHPR
jgi:hypothetical protein